jgi:hypothetical protein
MSNFSACRYMQRGILVKRGLACRWMPYRNLEQALAAAGLDEPCKDNGLEPMP